MKNLNPFDLEAAKAGAKVVNRAGQPVRIVCFDAKGMQPIIALHTIDTNAEELESHLIGGAYMNSFDESPYDLFLSPTTITGWVNVYKAYNSHILSGFWSSEEDAKEGSSKTHHLGECLGTRLIEIEI